MPKITINIAEKIRNMMCPGSNKVQYSKAPTKLNIPILNEPNFPLNDYDPRLYIYVQNLNKNLSNRIDQSSPLSHYSLTQLS